MKPIYISVICVILLSLSSCDNFEDINTNPNTPTTASASLLCTNVVLGIARFDGSDAKEMISRSALSKYVGYATDGQMATQYNRLGNTDFNDMTLLPNIDEMVKYAEGSNLESSYKGVAKFVRAYLFFYATLKVGDVPYSQAGKGNSDIYRTSYDLQEDVLLGILDELAEADEFFAQGEVFSGDPTPFAGDPEKWRRATNSFALKVLMTLSEKEGKSTIAVKERFAAIANAGNLLEESTGFFGLAYSSVNTHPLHGTNSIFTARTIISSTLVDNLKRLNDRRLFYYSEPAGAEITDGKSEDDQEAYEGVDVSITYEQLNANFSKNLYSVLNVRYLEEIATEPRMLITYAEQQLILAEAVIKGWIGGSAQTYYEQGTRSALVAFTKLNSAYAHGMAIDAAYIDSYFTGEAAFAADTQEQLKQIWMQRYLMHFLQDSESSYYEYRRTGYPVFPISALSSMNDNDKSAIPMRWLYPTSETNFNRENLIIALDRQYEGYDEINKTMWLLK